VVVSVKTTSGWQIQEANRPNPLEIPLQLNSVGIVGKITNPIGQNPISRSPTLQTHQT
jgi:hypothetical protein